MVDFKEQLAELRANTDLEKDGGKVEIGDNTEPTKEDLLTALDALRADAEKGTITSIVFASVGPMGEDGKGMNAPIGWVQRQGDKRRLHKTLHYLMDTYHQRSGYENAPPEEGVDDTPSASDVRGLTVSVLGLGEFLKMLADAPDPEKDPENNPDPAPAVAGTDEPSAS